MSTLNSRLRRLSLTIAAILIGLVAMEGYAQLARWIGFRTHNIVVTTARDEARLLAIMTGEEPFVAEATRILVLGDSLAYSPGVPYKDLWSKLLADRIRFETGTEVIMINAALADTNTWTHLRQVREIVPLMKPDIVLLMYNYGDIKQSDRFGIAGGEGVVGRSALVGGEAEALKTKKQIQVRLPNQERHPRPLLGSVLRQIKKRSLAMQGCLPRINMQLKAWGIVVPGSSFHHMSRVAYTPEYKGWIEVQHLLLEMRNFCDANDTKLAIFVLPQFTSLRRDLLSIPRRVLGEYLDTIEVPHGFGFEHFKGRSWEELAVSPFDYHPNVKANREIADLIYDWLSASIGFDAVQP